MAMLKEGAGGRIVAVVVLAALLSAEGARAQHEVVPAPVNLDFLGGGAEVGAPPSRSNDPAASPPPVESFAPSFAYAEPWGWQVLPEGIIYHSYLAGTKEPRFASQWVWDKNQGPLWDVTLGARVGLIRYGTRDVRHPEGWELDMEGAAFPRLDMEESLDVMSTDFRFGVPLTFGRGPYQTKFGFYHICAHLGDELMLNRPGEFDRINYTRNALAWGHSFYWREAIRLYAEAAWAFATDGGARPWEFQFGIDYSPAMPMGCRPAPFFAINGHLREDVNFGGNLVVETGYQWRGVANHLLRAGLQYFTGKSDQCEFYRRYEDKIGLGLWYDF
jgi:hypothetical protein